jgi:NAD(P)-dependent dehydrogenase (short-subunit alcohol dehydrogenase family)
MDYRDRHVVVTGGTGALGAAVVDALVEAGAVCHVPFVIAAEAQAFALRSHSQVKLVESADLTDEAAVAKLFDGVPRLWASIHLAGGFAMRRSPRQQTRSTQLDMNHHRFLCQAGAAMPRPGPVVAGIVIVAARPALECSAGAHGGLCSKAAVAAFTVALAEEVVKAGILVNVAPRSGHAANRCHAEARARRPARSRRWRRRRSALAFLKQGHARRRGAGLRAGVNEKSLTLARVLAYQPHDLAAMRCQRSERAPRAPRRDCPAAAALTALCGSPHAEAEAERADTNSPHAVRRNICSQVQRNHSQVHNPAAAHCSYLARAIGTRRASRVRVASLIPVADDADDSERLSPGQLGGLLAAAALPIETAGPPASKISVTFFIIIPRLGQSCTAAPNRCSSI